MKNMLTVEIFSQKKSKNERNRSFLELFTHMKGALYTLPISAIEVQ